MTTKTEVITRLSANTGLTKKEVAKVLSAFQVEVYSELDAKGEALVPGLGKLKIKQRSERRGRNPRTGEGLTIPARSVVKFTATRKLKQAVSG